MAPALGQHHMEIVIENEPHYNIQQQRPSSACATTYLRSPVSATPPQQPLINTGSAFYYATLPRGRPVNPNPSSIIVPDGAPITSSKHTLVGAEPELLTSKPRTGPRVKFATDEITSVGGEVLPPPPPPASARKSSVADCLGRLSPRQRGDRPQMTLSSIPDVIEAHETNTGERAEAEGCEHSGALDAVEEARIQSQTATATKTDANANNAGNQGSGLQAVHVIILSEQL
ncbi:hypothetical protein QAD02_004480 [Eretmocerus hayati]|uniref:Uncharacterized protein n=1 Tax=Eretmocerus hayati TaxID=131215 RepID=A0ACC2NQX9_9HYME|nr:hypothetical protein QAD02_004480 [Eretmocerus hayati]